MFFFKPKPKDKELLLPPPAPPGFELPEDTGENAKKEDDLSVKVEDLPKDMFSGLTEDFGKEKAKGSKKTGQKAPKKLKKAVINKINVKAAVKKVSKKKEKNAKKAVIKKPKVKTSVKQILKKKQKKLKKNGIKAVTKMLTMPVKTKKSALKKRKASTKKPKSAKVAEPKNDLEFDADFKDLELGTDFKLPEAAPSCNFVLFQVVFFDLLSFDKLTCLR